MVFIYSATMEPLFVAHVQLGYRTVDTAKDTALLLEPLAGMDSALVGTDAVLATQPFFESTVLSRAMRSEPRLRRILSSGKHDVRIQPYTSHTDAGEVALVLLITATASSAHGAQTLAATVGRRLLEFRGQAAERTFADRLFSTRLQLAVERQPARRDELVAQRRRLTLVRGLERENMYLRSAASLPTGRVSPHPLRTTLLAAVVAWLLPLVVLSWRDALRRTAADRGVLGCLSN